MFLWRRKPEGPLSDAELIDCYRETNDMYYVWELFDRYRDKILLNCWNHFKNKEESEDAVMDIFLLLGEKLLTQEIEDFKKWIWRVTKNHCLAKIEKREKRRTKEDEPGILKEIVENLGLNDLKNGYEDNDIRYHVAAAITKLNEPQKTCIRLRYWEDLSYVEISEMTGYTLKQVKSHLQNGKKMLEKMLKYLKD